MYEVDEKDRVVPLESVPQSSVGAPLPLILADENRVALAYYVQSRNSEWDGRSTRILDPVTSNEPLALIQFRSCAAHMLGPPNDEAFEGHPLAKRGLSPYRAFRIEGSSWIRKLERMNSVHPEHRPERFWKLQHFIFAFHDTTFECICSEFGVTMSQGSLHDAVPRMIELLA